MNDDMPVIGKPDPQDDDDVELSADQRAVLARELSEQAFGFKHVADLLHAEQPLPRSLLRSVLYMAEARTADACKLTSIELDSATAREERYATVRALHARVRGLEKQLGESGTPAQTKAHLQVCAENLRKWWRADGLGHLREMSFTEYGAMKAELSCHLFGDFALTGSSTPVSDKERRVQWLQYLNARGFVLLEAGRELELVDCDQNRTALAQLLSSAIPSAKVVSTRNHSIRSGRMVLRAVEIYVYDLQELHELRPVRPVEDEDA